MAQFPQDSSILITGSGGRLGRLLQRAAARDGTAGRRVIFQSRRPGADLTWAPCGPASRLPRCHVVVALWGRTAGSATELAENETLVATSHAVARTCGARALVHVSSAAVYGPGHAMTEQAPLRPASDYARSKHAMEQAVARLPADDGIVHCCLRLANVMGADSLAPALTGSGAVRLDRFPDRRGPIRSYIAASDLLRVLCGLAALPPRRLPAVLNVAAPAPAEMAALARVAGKEIAWHPAPETALQALTLDTGRLMRLLPGLEMLETAEQLVTDWTVLEAMT